MLMLLRFLLVFFIFSLTSVSASADDFIIKYGSVGKWQIYGPKGYGPACVAIKNNGSATQRIVDYVEALNSLELQILYNGHNITSQGTPVVLQGQMAFNGGRAQAIEFSVTPFQVALYTPTSSKVFERELRSSSQIEINIDRGWQTFSLKNSSAAINMVKQCSFNDGRRPAKRVGKNKPIFKARPMAKPTSPARSMSSPTTSVARPTSTQNVQRFSDIVNVPNSTEHKYTSVRGWDAYGGNVGG